MLPWKRRAPFSWRPCKEGFEAHDPAGPIWFDRDADGYVPPFRIEPHLFHTFSESSQKFTDEPWVGWTVTVPEGAWLYSWRRDPLGDDIQWPVFGLLAAMRVAEKYRFESNDDHGRVYNLLVARFAYRRFQRWLRKAVPATERDKRWGKLVEAEAKKRLEAEGAEPETITGY